MELYDLVRLLETAGFSPGEITFEIVDAIASTHPGAPQDNHPLGDQWMDVWATIIATIDKV